MNKPPNPHNIHSPHHRILCSIKKVDFYNEMGVQPLKVQTPLPMLLGGGRKPEDKDQSASNMKGSSGMDSLLEIVDM